MKNGDGGGVRKKKMVVHAIMNSSRVFPPSIFFF